MESFEIKNELNMKYDDLVNYLLNKYGPAKYDYFCNESCKSKNKKISRTNEGLYCHHIDEDKAILLSVDRFAFMNPWEYQKADRLVYCNVLEHLILHIKIVEKVQEDNIGKLNIQGIGGAVDFICPQINDYYNGFEFKQQYLINTYLIIEKNFDDYIDILKYYQQVVNNDPIFKKLITKEYLSKGWDGQIVKKVYKKL